MKLDRLLLLIPRPAALVLALASLTTANAARAHIGPAAVKAVLAMEAGAPSLLWLNEGLAVRRGDAWHYVCPSLWGDAEMGDAVPLEGGPVLIGANTGVWLFQADGSAAAGSFTVDLTDGIAPAQSATVNATIFGSSVRVFLYATADGGEPPYHYIGSVRNTPGALVMIEDDNAAELAYEAGEVDLTEIQIISYGRYKNKLPENTKVIAIDVKRDELVEHSTPAPRDIVPDPLPLCAAGILIPGQPP